LGYIAPGTVSNVANEDVGSDSEQPTPQSEAIVENIIESESTQVDPSLEMTIEDSSQEQEAKQKSYGITSNNYVSS
jgi:hypothetical protein